jgi:hypothetical protein
MLLFIFLEGFMWTALKHTLNQVLVSFLKLFPLVLLKNVVYFDNLAKLNKVILTVHKFNGVIGVVVRVR